MTLALIAAAPVRAGGLLYQPDIPDTDDNYVPPAVLVAFNPQPEPPAIPAFGLRVDVSDTGSDSVIVELALSDRRGNQIALQ